MDYVKSYTAKYNEPLSSFGGHGWDALQLVVDALSAVGDDRPQYGTTSRRNRDLWASIGIFNFSPDDHNGLTKVAFSMVVVKDNDWALVD